MISIIYKLKLYPIINVDTIYYLTGDNSKAIIKQTTNNVLEECVADIDEMKKNGLNVMLLKQSDMKKMNNTNNNSNLTNAMIFIDESHYGSKNDMSMLNQWLRKRGLDLKNSSDLINRNVYMISNSATPYMEIESDTAFSKRYILLRSGEGYIGLWKFPNYHPLSYSVFSGPSSSKNVNNIVREWYDYLQVLENNANFSKNKCVVARISSRQLSKHKNILEKYFDIVEINAQAGNVDYNLMNCTIDSYCSKEKSFGRTPGKYLMIVVQGGLRMGVRIDEIIKNYIGIIYDFTTEAKNVSATEQGILGRICGYRKGDDWVETRIYIRKDHYQSLTDFYNRKDSKNIVCTPYDYMQKRKSIRRYSYEDKSKEYKDYVEFIKNGGNPSDYPQEIWCPMAKRLDEINCENDYNDKWAISPQDFFESKIGTNFGGNESFTLNDLLKDGEKIYEKYVKPFLICNDDFYAKAQVLGTRCFKDDKQGSAIWCENFKTNKYMTDSTNYKSWYVESDKGVENTLSKRGCFRVMLDVRDLSNIIVSTVVGEFVWGREETILSSNKPRNLVYESMDTSKADI